MNRRRAAAALCAAAALVCAAPAAAQSADPNPGAVTLTVNYDFANAYMFRGIPQDESGVTMWPAADLGFALFSGDGGLKSVSVNVGTWNSLHTGDAGLDGPFRKLWYESDFYAAAGVGFAGGTTVGVTYTAYTSPNSMFSTVKEIAVKFAVDDSGLLGGAAIRPYVLLAKELALGLDEGRIAFGGAGQADGGSALGTYLEIGAAPGFTASRASVSVPVKVGLSVDNYYEGANGDERFGFFSVAGVATVPFTAAPTRFGTWNIHGGVEYQRLGDRNQALGEHQVIGSVGIGFSY
jgi:hypothetical protein